MGNGKEGVVQPGSLYFPLPNPPRFILKARIKEASKVRSVRGVGWKNQIYYEIIFMYPPLQGGTHQELCRYCLTSFAFQIISLIQTSSESYSTEMHLLDRRDPVCLSFSCGPLHSI